MARATSVLILNINQRHIRLRPSERNAEQSAVVKGVSEIGRVTTTTSPDSSPASLRIVSNLMAVLSDMPPMVSAACLRHGSGLTHPEHAVNQLTRTDLFRRRESDGVLQLDL